MQTIYDAKILIVDDNQDLLNLVTTALRSTGYNQLTACTGCAAAQAAFAANRPDLMILDINLPDGDGFTLFRTLHSMADIPALFLSARDADADRLFGLGLGADDYLTKPFLTQELLLRIQRILQRCYRDELRRTAAKTLQLGQRTVYLADALVRLPDGTAQPLTATERALLHSMADIPALFLSARDADADRLFGLGLGADDYLTKPFLTQELLLRIQRILQRCYRDELRRTAAKTLQLGQRTVYLADALVRLPDGTAQPLTATERALLQKLAENRGHIVTYDAVCEAVWGADYYGYENSLNVHIRHLREKLEPNPSKPQYLLTVRGIGYKLAEENAHNENFCSPDPPLCAGHSRYCAAGGRFAGGADFLCGVQVQCGGCNRLPGRRLG